MIVCIELCIWLEQCSKTNICYLLLITYEPIASIYENNLVRLDLFIVKHEGI